MEASLQPEDQVCVIGTEIIGSVERTHGSIETHDPNPEETDQYSSLTQHPDVSVDAFNRFLVTGVPPKGTVLVRWPRLLMSQIIPEYKLQLQDRSFLIGDVVKRSEQDAMSGVVINTFTKCTLEHMTDIIYNDGEKIFKGFLPVVKYSKTLNLMRLPAKVIDVPLNELQLASLPGRDDLVIYKGWLGKIEETEYTYTLKLADDSLVEISESWLNSPVHADDFTLGDIAAAGKSHLRQHGKFIWGSYNPDIPPAGTIVHMRLLCAYVDWIEYKIEGRSDAKPPARCIRSEIKSPDFQIYDRTKAPAQTAAELSSAISNAEIEIQLGSRVRFKDLLGACVKYDGTRGQGKIDRTPEADSHGYDMNVFNVSSFTTDVDIQWQDLTVTRERSVDLLPDTSVDDEYAAWPGEIAYTIPLKPVPNMYGVVAPDKVGVIQSVNGLERMARVRWCPDAQVMYSHDPENEGGFKTLVSQVVPRATGEEENVSLYEIDTPASLNVRRGDVVLINLSEESSDDWIGDIVDTRLDGALTVRIRAGSVVKDVIMNRQDCVVAVRSDDTDAQIDAAMDFPFDAAMDDEHDDDSDYDSEEDIDQQVRPLYEDENGELMDEDDVEDPDWESEGEDEDGDTQMSDKMLDTPPSSNSPTPTQMEKPRNDAHLESQASTEQHALDEVPARYEVLDTSVPDDHRFKSTKIPSNQVHMKRMHKEHKVLRSPENLPPGVYIRTWESRLDLLRVLFIGPGETPYASAPFVVDIHLQATFPYEPPQAFFHSWVGENGLGGVGKVNPNLYEDGKICLSLLGTWDGGSRENWDSRRSTLLQLIVSLLGLVLVREPYFNEAGYEPLAGLESSKRPSALYNERTYLRTRAFIIQALAGVQPGKRSKLTNGLAGLEFIISWLYYDERGDKMLDKIIAHAEDVLSLSESCIAEPDGMMFLSKGACIPLRRIIERLQQLR